MSVLVDVKFKAKAAAAAAFGRHVSHTSAACESCRKLKVRCSGSPPCEQCCKRGNEQGCVITETRKTRGRRFTKAESKMAAERKVAIISSSSESSSSSSSSSRSSSNGNDDKELQSEEALTTTSKSYQNNEQQLMLIAERLLADASTAKFLLDVFIRRIHPHINNMAPSTTFSLDEIFDRTLNPSDAIQRDAGLAMACRMCGHETLGNLLMKRMEITYEKVKEEPVSNESYSATALFAVSVCGVHMKKGMGLVLSAFTMRQELFARKDPIAATCEFLDQLSISDSHNNTTGEGTLSGMDFANSLGCNEENGMYNDCSRMTKAEITAHVQMAVSQMNQWSTTLEDLELRFLVNVSMEMDAQLAAPAMRPGLMVQAALVVDLHLLGCLTPPRLMEFVRRHDPEGSFGLVGICKPSAAPEDILEPCHLSEEITASLLRRVFVCRTLFFESKVDPDVVTSYIATTEVFEIIIQWRSGNREKATKIGRWLLQFLEHQNLDFWNPMLCPSFLLLGNVFFEMRDALGLMRTISVLSRLRRSQPTVKVGIEVLRELQSRLIEERV